MSRIRVRDRVSPDSEIYEKFARMNSLVGNLIVICIIPSFSGLTLTLIRLIYINIGISLR
jgi:hypothetical protein